MRGEETGHQLTAIAVQTPLAWCRYSDSKNKYSWFGPDGPTEEAIVSAVCSIVGDR